MYNSQTKPILSRSPVKTNLTILIPGKNSKDAIEFLEKNYKNNMTLEEGLSIAAQVIDNSVDNPKTNSEIMVVSCKDTRTLTKEELEKLYESIEIDSD